MSVLKKSLLATSILLSAASHATEAPKYVFYMIGDGMSSSQRQLAEYYAQEQKHDDSYKLTINSMPVTGIITTRSANTLVTDSAAAGTALATGVKTDNGMIGMTPDSKKLKTLLEGAEGKGWATGLVTTTRITHATPATFAAKNVSRDNEAQIADDLSAANIDYLAGGGASFFLKKGEQSKRTDDRDLVSEMKTHGYKTFIGGDSVDDLMEYKPKAGDKVFAALSSSHLPYDIDRVNQKMDMPSLAELTQKGVDLLSQDKDGFFMMVEGGRIDHAAHANDIAGTINDTIAFDDAVKVAVDFYNEHPNETLIVVVGDHETGGMGLGQGENYFMNLDKVAKFDESIEDSLQGVYQGSRPEFYLHLANKFSLTDLTDSEKKQIETAMDFVDSGDKDEAQLYGNYDPVAITVAHITSKRAGIYWTSYAHTGTQLPVTAEGVGAQSFGGFKDNTEVAQTLAKLMNVSIGR